MGLDRYYCICHVIKSFTWTVKKASFEILFSWLLAALLTSPQFYIWSNSHNSVANGTSCYAHFPNPSHIWEKVYVLYHGMTHFLIPLIILVFLYTKITITVNKSVKSKKMSLVNNITTTTTSSLKFNEPTSSKPNESACMLNDNFKQRYSFKKDFSRNSGILLDRQAQIRQIISKKSLQLLWKAKIKTFKLTLTVVLTFVLCTLPFYSITFYLTIKGKPSKITEETMMRIYCKLFFFFLNILNSPINF